MVRTFDRLPLGAVFRGWIGSVRIRNLSTTGANELKQPKSSDFAIEFNWETPMVFGSRQVPKYCLPLDLINASSAALAVSGTMRSGRSEERAAVSFIVG